ncbi:MAG: carboxyl transferase domain-containing protein, partial [Phycisphaerae bacterium]
PGVGAEERGIAQAIAVNLMDMARLPTPIVCVVVGEGGSGGALGIGVGDRVAMLEHAWYSVISPEGCAAILWKSGEYAADAAQALKLTSRHLSDLGLVDDVIPEPLGGAHRNREATVTAVRDYIVESLNSLKRLKTDTLLNRRYKRLRNLGACFERAEARAAQTPPRAGRPAAVKLPAKTARAPSAATQQSDAVAAPLARANR